MDTIEIRHEIEDLSARMHRLKEQLRQEELRQFVQVQFHGNGRRYCYQLRSGHTAEIGDYVAVYSPYTDQTELVRVVSKGRGAWTGPTKIASQVDWTVRP